MLHCLYKMKKLPPAAQSLPRGSAQAWASTNAVQKRMAFLLCGSDYLESSAERQDAAKKAERSSR